MPGHSFRTDIEGLRGLAVLAVVLFHVGMPGVGGGFFGVDVFFVLSGYLITGLLLGELASTGRVRVPRFYARRARRLLPAASVMIVATMAASVFVYSPGEQERYGKTALAAALYASNLLFNYRSVDYFGAAIKNDPYLHTWSLAVEEQFYLVWPLLVVALYRLARGRMDRVALGLGALTLASFCAFAWTAASAPESAFFGSPHRAWEFGVGALAARVPAGALGLAPARVRALGWVGLALVLCSCTLFGAAMPFPSVAAVLPVAATALVLVAGARGDAGGAARLLNAAPLQYLGRLSYSWYLWHWPVLILCAAVAPLPLAGRVGAAAFALVLADVTHRAVENPVRFNARLMARPGLSIALAAVLTVCVAGAVMAGRAAATRWVGMEPFRTFANARESPENHECAMNAQGRWVPCAAPRPSARPTVVLFGDSHASHFAPGLQAAAGREGWRFVKMTMGGCPATDVPVFNPDGPAVDERCRRWREEAFQRIAALRPGVVVVSSALHHVQTPRPRDDRRAVSLNEWREGSRRTYLRLARAGARVIQIRPTPTLGFNGTTCMARATWQARWFGPVGRTCNVPRSVAVDRRVFQAQRGAAAGVPGVSFVDLTDRFCSKTTCMAAVGGVPVFRDYDHVSVAFSRTLAPYLAGAVRASLAAK